MKYFVLFLLTLLGLFAEETRELFIEGKPYLFVAERYNEYGDKGVTMKLYKKEKSFQTQPIFSFILENQSGDCSAKSTQESAYKINGSMLTLYTHWDRSGRAYDAPKGDRIQHYHMDNNGTVHFVDGQLCIEDKAKNYDKQSAIQYLYHTPKSPEEDKALTHYIKRIEKIFKGRFLSGDDAKALQLKVEKMLEEKKRTRWQ